VDNLCIVGNKPDISYPERAPDFALADHDEMARPFASLMGSTGLILGFVGDVWMPNNAQLLRWLQRLALPLRREGIDTALVASNASHILRSFYASSPVPPLFPLLADADRRVHRLYGMERLEGLFLIDSMRRIHARWLLSSDKAPRPKQFLRAVRSFQLSLR
jgi:peroxiredoxin